MLSQNSVESLRPEPMAPTGMMAAIPWMIAFRSSVAAGMKLFSSLPKELTPLANAACWYGSRISAVVGSRSSAEDVARGMTMPLSVFVIWVLAAVVVSAAAVVSGA